MRTTLAAIGVLCAFALVGCTVVSPPLPEPSIPPTAIPTETALPEGAEPAVDIPTDVPNDTSLRPHVVLTECVPVDGGWEARGTAVNPGSEERTYTITVFFSTPAATVLDHATTTVSVAPGDVGTWSAGERFASGGDARCVIRGVS